MKKIARLFILVCIVFFLNDHDFEPNAIVYAMTIPTPISPSNGTITTVENYPPLGIPTLEWTRVSDATEYRLQISQDINFSSIDMEITTSNTIYTPTYMNSSLFADGEWYWRIRVEKPYIGMDSAPMLFVKKWASPDNQVLLLFPEKDANLNFFSAPSFTWSWVSGATSYIFLISNSQDGFSSPTYNHVTVSNSHQPVTKLANGQYYWRVVPVDSVGHVGKESEVRSVFLSYGSEFYGEIPELYAPENSSQITFTPEFSWEAIPGAEKYRIEYMPDDGLCEYGSGLMIETRMTSYTPPSTLADGNYCWHVSVISGESVGEWSETWRFRKQWDIQPILLTPTNGYAYGNYPLFSWTPVPGSSYYKIEIVKNQDWASPFDIAQTANLFYMVQKNYGTLPQDYSWRITPYDWDSHPGRPSPIFSFQSYYTSTTPSLLYPFYYYVPNNPYTYGSHALNPYEDRAIPYPTFLWHRISNPWPYGGTYAPAYRVQVSTSLSFSPILWQVDTESTHASPTLTNPFPNINPDQDYYWRVCPLDVMGGICMVIPGKGEAWSQIWLTRINPEKGSPPSDGEVPLLLSPQHGEEWIEATPLLEWQAVENADYYQVQISRNPSFPNSDQTITEEVPYPIYSSTQSLAQRYLDRLGYGTYYWHARASIAGTWNSWSETRRFQIASQSEWRFDRISGDSENRLLIGTDETGDAIEGFDLTNLYASNSKDNWYLGFDLTIAPESDMVYGLYLDLDNKDGSGASLPPQDREYLIRTIPAHEPEIAIYIDQFDGIINAENTWIHSYINDMWQEPCRLEDTPGALLYVDAGFLELQLPNASLELNHFSGSISVILFSIDPGSEYPLKDTVPSNPESIDSGILSAFTSVSEQMNLYHPPNNSEANPATFPSLTPFSWDYPTGGDPSGIDIDPPTPWAGIKLDICLDEFCSTILETLDHKSKPYYFASSTVTSLDDIYGDNTYFWRIQPRYLHNDTEFFGSYSDSHSFQRQGFVPVNLQTSVTFATPMFSWDMTEGAGSYDLQVSTSPYFNSSELVININALTQNYYTPVTTLGEGDYWWRVRARRYGNILNQWTPATKFSIDLPSPTGLIPDDPSQQNILEDTPTLCWNHLIAYQFDLPILTAWRYRVEVSEDPMFGSIFDSIITEQNCYTPNRIYPDGTYYWHVAMVDGNERIGGYSEFAQFTKQYSSPVLQEPIGKVMETPTFQWAPVQGAISYYLQISQFPTFSSLYDFVETINTQYTPIRDYESNRMFYWRVAMKDGDGNLSVFTDSSFIISNYILNLPILIK